MAIDINEGIQSEEFDRTHFVYADNVKVKYPNKENKVAFCILPAIADPKDMTSYLPYRDENDERWTSWASSAHIHPFVNKESSIISPKTFDPHAFDPIEQLIKVARYSPEWRAVAGYLPNGKRDEKAYKNPECRLAARQTIFVVNAIILNDTDFKDTTVVLQIPSTAFRGQHSRDAMASSDWGLINKLMIKNRNASEDDDFDTKYYWGDITNPKRLLPLIMSQQKSPTGGPIGIYNIVPHENIEPVSVTKSILANRYDLNKVFYEIEQTEILELLVNKFSDLPDLLRAAFSDKVPGFNKMLQNSVSTARSVSKDDDTLEDDFSINPKANRKVDVSVDDELDMSPPKRSFAPSINEEEEEEEEEEGVTVTGRRPTRKVQVKDDDDEEEDSSSSENIELEQPTRVPVKKKSTKVADIIGEDD